MPDVGDVLLSDLFHYLHEGDLHTSRICAFMLGLQNAPWNELKKANLYWTDIYKQYEEETIILPRIELEFH